MAHPLIRKDAEEPKVLTELKMLTSLGQDVEISRR
jgi:hypothetical protein